MRVATADADIGPADETGMTSLFVDNFPPEPCYRPAATPGVLARVSLCLFRYIVAVPEDGDPWQLQEILMTPQPAVDFR